MRSITGVGRDNTFDFLRLFAALVVVLAHAQFELRSELLWNASQLFDGIGMFFVMSGFLVWQSAVSIERRTGSFRVYFQNRALRILPGLYTYALLMPLVLVAVGAIPLQSLLTKDMLIWLGSAAFIVPGYDPAIWAQVGTGNMNGHLYTIPAEVSFYAVVPVLVLMARRWGFRWVVVALSAAAIAGPVLMFFLTGPITVAVHYTFLERAGYFLVGVFAAVYRERIVLSARAFVLALAAYFTLKIFGTGHDWFRVVQPLWLAAPLGYCMLFFGYRGPKGLQRFTSWFGDLSYGTYIWHVLVVELFVWAGWVGHWWQVLAVLCLSLAAAQISWRFIERPALGLKKDSSSRAARESSSVGPQAV
ncbi:acyltransferase [Pseudarthrobacter sp. BRE9]|uniref:acyltransferase family protein n=1 Tax=Pseudarthrobacter sp. BRE9 TaxID=2962582 RepID=UPI002881DB68|nr:acyltransferase [Pseudarthrobacter sp. BRE9]MDT0168116.1 acyltransferase [Pseudarthrobacter sp. BRE9]